MFAHARGTPDHQVPGGGKDTRKAQPAAYSIPSTSGTSRSRAPHTTSVGQRTRSR